MRMVCALTQFSLYYTYIHMDIFHFYYRHALNECFREQGTRSRSFPADSSHIRHSNLFPLFSFSLSSPCNFTRCFIVEAASLISRSPSFPFFCHRFFGETFISSFTTAMVHRFVQLLFFPECVSPFH